MGEPLKDIWEVCKPLLSGIGAIVLYIAWTTKRLPFTPVKAEKHERRRRDDEVLQLVVGALQDNARANHESAQANHSIAEALRENGRRIDALTAEIRIVATGLEEVANEARKAIGDIHRRIDGLLGRQ
jgi:hypothetical protein